MHVSASLARIGLLLCVVVLLVLALLASFTLQNPPPGTGLTRDADVLSRSLRAATAVAPASVHDNWLIGTNDTAQPPSWLSSWGIPGASAPTRFPWVFTYNDNCTEYDPMLKAAVLSAVRVAHLQPFCLFSGSSKSAIYTWLVQQGVTLVQHHPLWADKFWQMAEPQHTENMAHSHLYASKATLVGTFQRIDIPIIPEFKTFQYVLYTDTDVLFLSRFTLEHVAMRPPFVAMAPEMTDAFPFNAGILLMNLPGLRQTYPDLLASVLSNKHGLYFPQYGPLDQGVLNQQYETSLRQNPLPKHYNAKPYQPCVNNAVLLHMHGPKTFDYEEFFLTGKCRFADMCKQGFQGCFCKYLLASDHTRDAYSKLAQMCSALNNTSTRRRGRKTMVV